MRASKAASSIPSARSRSRAALATNVEVIAAVMIARKAIPSSMTTVAISLPDTSFGVTSPYPTVVTVWIAHHMPTQTFAYSLWSKTHIAMPLPTTINAVAVTITLAAMRIEGGERRNFDMRRSKRLCGSGALRTVWPAVSRCRRVLVIVVPPEAGARALRSRRRSWRDHRPDEPEDREEDPDDEHHPVALPEGHHPERDQQDEIEERAESDSPPHRSSYPRSRKSVSSAERPSGSGGAHHPIWTSRGCPQRRERAE